MSEREREEDRERQRDIERVQLVRKQHIQRLAGNKKKRLK